MPTKFLSSLISKKLGFAVALEGYISQLPMTADAKGYAMMGVGVFYFVAQAWVDSKLTVPQLPDAPATESK